MGELKPCPFCGGSAKRVYDSESGYPVNVAVSCADCGAVAPKVRGTKRSGIISATDERRAIAAWNRRKVLP